MGKNLLDLIIPSEMRTEVRQAIAQMMATGVGIPASELSLRRKDGSRVAVFSNHTVTEVSGRGKEFYCIDIDLTARKRIESALQMAHQRLDALVSNLYVGVMLVAEDDRIEYVNQAFCDLFDLMDTPTSLRGLSLADRTQKLPVAYASPDRELAHIRQIRAAGQPVRNEEIAITRGRVYLRDYIPIVVDGQPQGRLWFFHDITARKQMEEKTALKNKQLALLYHLSQALVTLATVPEILERISVLIGQVFDNRNLYIAMYDETRNYISFPVYLVAGVRQGLPIERPLSNGLTEFVIRTRAPLLISENVNQAMAERGVALIGTPCQCYLGVPILIEDQVIGVLAVQDYEQAKVYDASHVEVLSTVASQAAIAIQNARLYETVRRELTERKQLEDDLRDANLHLEDQLAELKNLHLQVREQAVRDPLTQLYNRRYLNETFPREIALALRQNYTIGVLMLDIDRFKEINDTCGHLAGDATLQLIARTLTTHLRASDIICRYGGEEFLCLLMNVTREFTLQRAEQLRAAIADLSRTADAPMRVTASCGVALLPTHGSDMIAILKAADQALYQAKTDGRNCIRLAPTH